MSDSRPSVAEAVAPLPAPKLSAERIPVLDGLRGIAVLLVLFRHFGDVETAGPGQVLLNRATEAGWTGVDLFFVLSGFLITGILLDTRDSENYFRSFYARRVLRIFPLYYFSLIVSIFVFAPLTGATELADRQLPLWTYLANLDVVRYGWFTGDASIANHLWSLSVEEQFYFLWPLLVFWVDRRRLLWLAAAGVFISPAIRIWLDATGHAPFVAYVATPSRVDSLAMGAFIAIAMRGEGGIESLRKYAPAALLVAMVALGAVWMKVPHYRFSNWTVLHWGVPAQTLGFGAVLVLGVTGSRSARLSRFLSADALRFFGRYSYAMYVWHPLVSRLVAKAGVTQEALAHFLLPGAVTTMASIAIRVAATTIVSLLSWHLLEARFLRLKDRVQARPRRAAEVARVPAA